MVSTEIKKKIEEHLNLSYKLHIAAKEVLENRNLSITKDVATKYGLEYPILYRKVNIMRHKEEFYDRKSRLDAARKGIIEGRFTYDTASFEYGFSAGMLNLEVKKARYQKNYEYDRKISTNGTGFTYLQEESLLMILKDWARRESAQGGCSCTLCALEKLLTLAYEFAQQNNMKRPDSWDLFKHASIDWLKEFEMRHTDEINLSFLSFVDIFKQIIG